MVLLLFDWIQWDRAHDDVRNYSIFKEEYEKIKNKIKWKINFQSDQLFDLSVYSKFRFLVIKLCDLLNQRTANTIPNLYKHFQTVCLHSWCFSFTGILNNSKTKIQWFHFHFIHSAFVMFWCFNQNGYALMISMQDGSDWLEFGSVFFLGFRISFLKSLKFCWIVFFFFWGNEFVTHHEYHRRKYSNLHGMHPNGANTGIYNRPNSDTFHRFHLKKWNTMKSELFL